MATLSSKLVFLFYADSPGSATSKLICLKNCSYNGSRTVITDETRCGVLKETGPASHQFTGEVVFDDAPAGGEASYNEIQALFINDTQKYWTLTDAGNTLFHGGYGKITNLTQANPESGHSSATLTVEITGDLDIIPES